MKVLWHYRATGPRLDRDQIADVIGDMASPSLRYQKPLSARLFPVPGKSAGETVSNGNPYLTDSTVMGLE